MFNFPPCRPLILWVVGLLCLLWGTAWGQSAVTVVLAERGEAHLEVLGELRSQLSRSGGPLVTVNVIGYHEVSSLPRNTAVVVAVGAKAMEAMAAVENSPPVVATLLPRSTYEQTLPLLSHGRRFSAVFLDQSPERQLNLIRVALPEYRRVAVLAGLASRGRALALASAAPRGMKVNLETVGKVEELFPALQRVLADADLLLAVPDPVIYNSQTISNILLTAYHGKVPVVGFSAAYVRAGALISLYSTPAQLVGQVTEMVRGALVGHGLPGPQYPKEFTIGVNAHVARSFSLSLEDEAILRARIRELEKLP